MFDEFSPKYESSFRVVFVIWVLFWAVVNIFQILRNYADYASTSSFIGSDYVNLGHWWFITFGMIIGFAIGIFLLFWTVSVPSRIEKNKKIGSIGILMSATVVYYFFTTIIDLMGSALFNPENFINDFAFGTLWLLPSIIILVFHMFYYINLQKHNKEVESNPLGVPKL